MNKYEIFNIWAPPQGIWSPWAKPVLFSEMREAELGNLLIDELPIDISWAAGEHKGIAVVVDLPGVDSVRAGLMLAKLGYRPVPMYNARTGPPVGTTLVDLRSIMFALAAGAPRLADAGLQDDAPPAFLLDANRNFASISPRPGMYDNRSISLPTDFPSVNLLLSEGIKEVVVLQAWDDEPKADLSHTLRRWQDGGIVIRMKAIETAGEPQPIVVRRPPRFRLLWYAILASIGLKRHPLGGFGGRLPMPSSG